MNWGPHISRENRLDQHFVPTVFQWCQSTNSPQHSGVWGCQKPAVMGAHLMHFVESTWYILFWIWLQHEGREILCTRSTAAPYLEHPVAPDKSRWKHVSGWVRNTSTFARRAIWIIILLGEALTLSHNSYLTLKQIQYGPKRNKCANKSQWR